MRGGFVACLGDHGGRLERAAERLRWHRGSGMRYRKQGLEIAALCDPGDGPTVDCTSGSLVLVHGGAADPLAVLQSGSSRFASLHWDGAVLRATRDPMGLAPLFYRVAKGAVWLASEVHALLGIEPDAPHLSALTARAGFAPIDEETGWAGIRRVLPGCTLEIDGELRIKTLRYWDPARRLGTFGGDRADAVGELRERFRSAVARCYAPGSAVVLSGGQDSAAVAAGIPATADKPYLVHVEFAPLPRTQETRYAQAVASALDVPLHCVPGELGPWDIEAELDVHCVPYSWLPFGIDEPVQSHLRASGVRVALDGHDGDGVLGPSGGAWGKLLLGLEIERLIALSRSYGIRRAVHGLLSDLAPPGLRRGRYARRPTYMESVATYFLGDLSTRIRAQDIDRWSWPSQRWKVRQVHPLLPAAVISFEHKEIEAARHGIDLRHPFADRELVDFMISLPCAAKADPVRAKSLMMEALGSDLPDSIRERPKSDYMEVVGQRVDAASCLETIRSSRMRLPDVDYDRLFERGDAAPEEIPLFLLVNLARVHEFARRAR
ncbi:asparagine synthase-related protein [Ramlibacter monticola]|nr:asparagine synthase-related protein [Ramlibacter monticola]